MIAYNGTSLDNKNVQEQAGIALDANGITIEEYAQIQAAHPVGLYTPNVYIRIGLFLLTLVIVLFSAGLLALMSNSSHSIGGLLIFTGLLCYGILEYLISNKNHFRSRVDDALLWIAVVLMLSGLSFCIDNVSDLSCCAAVFVMALLGLLRFADCCMALVAYSALLGMVFNIASESGATGKLFISFQIMAVSVASYFLFSRLNRLKSLRHYRLALKLLKVAALISFYLAVNYFVVREMSAVLFHLPVRDGQGIPLGWLFWTLTIATPLLYICRGIQKKDPAFLWVGLVLCAAAVYTVRNYYHVLPVGSAMVLGGILLIAIAYGLIRYLKRPRLGFTFQETDDRHFLEAIHIESLVIAETFTPAAPPTDNFQFGGGSGGGGGAGGQY